MRVRPFLLTVPALFVLVGCGGNSSIKYAPGPQFYEGSFMLLGSSPFGSGSGPMIATYQAGNLVSATSPVGVAISRIGQSGVIVSQGIIADCTFRFTNSPDSAGFDCFVNSNLVGTAVLKKGTFPTLGATVSVPPAGNYHGELLVIANGTAVAIGEITATIDSAGSWVVNATGTTGYVDGFFYGQMQPSGAFLNSTLIANGSVYEEPTAQFSYDGTTIVARYDGLELTPGVAWLSLTAGSVPAANGGSSPASKFPANPSYRSER